MLARWQKFIYLMTSVKYESRCLRSEESYVSRLCIYRSNQVHFTHKNNVKSNSIYEQQWRSRIKFFEMGHFHNKMLLFFIKSDTCIMNFVSQSQWGKICGGIKIFVFAWKCLHLCGHEWQSSLKVRRKNLLLPSLFSPLLPPPATMRCVIIVYFNSIII